METLKNTWLNYDVFIYAFNKAKFRKSYQNTILRYEANLSSNIESLMNSIESGTYRPKPYREFTIYEPKTRVVHAPAFEDRIVHHAVMHAVEPLAERTLIYDTYACRKGKGTIRASKRLQKFMRGGYKYVLKIDVKKFFYTVSHERLSEIIGKLIKCDFTNNIIKLFYLNGTGTGLPLGNVTSQMFANLALSPIDNFAKRKLGLSNYVRYMDDIIVLHDDKDYLRYCKGAIKEALHKEGLQLNNKTFIKPVKSGVDFVGFKHFLGKKFILNKSLRRFRKAISKTKSTELALSYLSFAKDSNSYHILTENFLKVIPPEGIIGFSYKHKRRISN